MKPRFFNSLTAVVAAVVATAAFFPAGSEARANSDEGKHFVLRLLNEEEVSGIDDLPELDGAFALVLYSEIDGLEVKALGKRRSVREVQPYDGEKYVFALASDGKRAKSEYVIRLSKNGYEEKDFDVSFREDSLKAFEIDYIDELPRFMGESADSFKEWVSSNLKYPEGALGRGAEGTVVINFAVDENGYLTDITVAKGVAPDLDSEAVRIISMSPQWTPALKDGSPVKLYFQFPVIFLLRDSKRPSQVL